MSPVIIRIVAALASFLAFLLTGFGAILALIKSVEYAKEEDFATPGEEDPKAKWKIRALEALMLILGTVSLFLFFFSFYLFFLWQP